MIQQIDNYKGAEVVSARHLAIGSDFISRNNFSPTNNTIT